MVDVSAKPVTHRIAEAEALVHLPAAVARALTRSGHRTKKGPVFDTAILAGVMAAKRTSELIPLCHPLALTHIDVRAKLCKNGIAITSEASATGPTGVEMEALVAASVAALTIYDMCKALERGMEITEVYVVRKSGGRSGVYLRPGKRV